MRVILDSHCGLHVVKGKDKGIYTCNNCIWCKDKRQTLTGSYVGECKNPKK